MKTILCFGDSNTWGYNPHDEQRYSMEDRWPGVMRKSLGAGYWVIEEGLNGRTTVFDDPLEGYRNGLPYLVPCLESHRPLDLVILMLGTNDFKVRFSATAYDVARGLERLIKIILASGAGPDGSAPPILIVAPAPFEKLTEKAEPFEGAEEKSRRLASYYRGLAETYGLEFLDAGEIIQSSTIDGFHLEVSEHHKLGRGMSDRVRKILPAI
jgi:lysophospholipase L1-like esterase